MRSTCLLLLVSVGCVGGPPEPWGEGDVSVSGDQTFSDTVVRAVSRWDLALYPRCGRMVIRIVPRGGHPVEQVRAEDWGSARGDASVGGFFDGDRIAIQGGLPEGTEELLVHELGHSLGLHHIPWQQDLDSVMFPVIVIDRVNPSIGDIDRAAVMFGCP